MRYTFPKEVERSKESRTESSPESRPSNDVPIVVEMSDEFNCRISWVLRSTSEKMSNASFDPSLFVSINSGHKCQIIKRNDETIDVNEMTR